MSATNGGESTSVTVRVPATSANLGPGFDALGLALGLYDEVTVSVPRSANGNRTTSRSSESTSHQLSLNIIGEGTDNLPRDESHLVVRALYAGLDRHGIPRPERLALRCVNRIPHGRGLGSSAAAIVAGLAAAQALVAPESDPADLLGPATELEGHPDNVAACLLGGLAIAWTPDNGRAAPTARAVRLEPREDLAPVVFVPDTAVSTDTARGLLPDVVRHGDAASNAGRSALLVAALTTPQSRDVLWAATADRIHQAYRAPAMQSSYELVEKLRDNAVPAVISGAGPTVLAFGEVDLDVRGFARHRLEVDRQGVIVAQSG